MNQGLISEQIVIEEVKKAIVETLGMEASTIQADSSLMRDLGAESLDFLDINYRLEQVFGIKMARHSLLEHIEEVFGEDSAIDGSGQLTELAVSMLRTRLDESAMELSPGMDMDEVPSMVTVRSMARNVLDVLASLPEKCSNCGQAAWETTDTHRIQCQSCGTPATFTNGDDLIHQWLTEMKSQSATS
jgi:acyl carrier protein